MIIYLKSGCDICGLMRDLTKVGNLNVCEDCLWNCDGCGEAILKQGRKRCSSCGASVCESCITEDGCANCIAECHYCSYVGTEYVHCNDCGRVMCYNCSQWCEECEDNYCEECVGHGH